MSETIILETKAKYLFAVGHLHAHGLSVHLFVSDRMYGKGLHEAEVVERLELDVEPEKGERLEVYGPLNLHHIPKL